MLSEEQAKIYDRQIRLWGIDAQQRISKSKVLVVGMNGLSAEICKNIVLSGVGFVHLMDNVDATYKDLGTQFLIREESIGQNRAKASHSNLQELNPFSKITFEEASIKDKTKDFFNSFDIVLLNNCSLDEQIRVNDICREKNIFFFSTNTFGLFAITFEDLLDKFDFKVTIEKNTVEKSDHFISIGKALSSNLSKVSRLSKAWIGVYLLLIFQSLNGDLLPGSVDELLSLKDNLDLIKRYLPNISKQQLDTINRDYATLLCRSANTEVNTICSVVGGVIGQEIIKVISRDCNPINNYFIYENVETYCGFIEKIQ